MPTFPSDTQSGVPRWLNKFTPSIFRARTRTSVGDSNAANKVPVIIQGAASQTASLLEMYNSAKTFLGGFDASGNSLDGNGLARVILNPTTKAVPDASATALFDVACAAAAMIGGVFVFTVEASDGTDHQSLSGVVSYSAVNKAGTHTCTITQLSTVEAKAVSSGTLTLAWTCVTGTNKVTVKLQPTGSLTETIERITFTVFPIVGAVTIV